MDQRRRGVRGRGRTSGSAVAGGRGHTNQRSSRGGRGRSRGVGIGVQLPNYASTRASILSFGLSLVGFDLDRQDCREELSIRRFRSHYGIGPKAVQALVNDMLRYQKKSINMTALFIALYWLKLYPIEEVMAGTFNDSEEVCRKKSQEYAKRIQFLKKLKINFRDVDNSCEFLPVDVVHMKTQEFRCTPSTMWYSHKSNGPALAYEAVTDPVNGKIVWFNGPKPPTISDIEFLRGGKAGRKNEWDKSALYFHIPNNAKLVGDSAYGGQPDKVTTTNNQHNRKTKEMFARMKSFQETVFNRMKNFTVCSGTFRHGSGTDDKKKKHKMVAEAVAVLVEYDIENGHPLFEV